MANEWKPGRNGNRDVCLKDLYAVDIMLGRRMKVSQFRVSLANASGRTYLVYAIAGVTRYQGLLRFCPRSTPQVAHDERETSTQVKLSWLTSCNSIYI